MHLVVNGKPVCRLEIARGFRRIMGLMFKKEYPGALLFENVKGEYFHTFFCRFPILFVFVEEGRVKRVAKVKPWRVIKSEYPTVIELDGRRDWRIKEGDLVEIGGKG